MSFKWGAHTYHAHIKLREARLVQHQIEKHRAVKSDSYAIRKVAKSGSSRYLSVNKLIPQSWEAVKVYVIELKGDYCVLKLVKIA